MKVSVLFLLLIVSGVLSAQQDTSLVRREKQLASYLDILRKAQSDTEKEAANKQFKSYLHETILLQGAIDYPFSALKTMGSVKSPDNSFRLFNWNVEQDDESHKFYCYILRLDERKKQWKTIELIDNSLMLPPQPDDILNDDMWYGALYYKIIPVEKSNKTYYTLLGYDPNNAMSHMKLIDVLSFSGNRAKLGSPIFKMKDKVYKRLFFEHSKRAVMSLNYDEARQRIIYDHLSPESPGMEGFHEFYVPDMSYDALKFVNSKWVLEETVIAINGKGPKTVTISAIDRKTGQVTERQVKNTWVDPSNPNAPAGGNIHTATMPEDPVIGKEKPTQKPVSEFPDVKKRKKQKDGLYAVPQQVSKKKKRLR